MTIQRDNAATTEPVVNQQPTGIVRTPQAGTITRQEPPMAPPEDQWSLGAASAWVWNKFTNLSLGVEGMLRGGLKTVAQLGDTMGGQDSPLMQTGLPLRGISSGFSQLNDVDKYLEKTQWWTPPVENPSFGDQIAQGLGSAIGFLAAGLPAKTLEGATLAAGGLGALVGAGQQVLDAEQYTKDEVEQTLAALGGAAFGATEAVFGYSVLSKINKATGGGLYKTLERAGLTKTPNVLANPSYFKEIVSSFGAEFAQEALQTAGGNWVAQTVYDPDRPIGEGVGEAAMVGGIVGALFGGGSVPFQKHIRNQQLSTLKAEYDRLVQSGNAINDFVGPAMSLFNLPELKNELLQLDELFDKNADDAVNLLLSGNFPAITQAFSGLTQEKTEFTTPNPSIGITDPSFDVFGDAWDSVATVADTNLNKTLIGEEQARGTRFTTIELLMRDDTSVVITESNKLTDDITATNALVQKLQTTVTNMEAKIKEREANNVPVPAQRAVLRTQKQKLKEATDRQRKLFARAKAEAQLMKHVAKYIEKFNEVLGDAAITMEGQELETYIDDQGDKQTRTKYLDPTIPAKFILYSGPKEFSGAYTTKYGGQQATYRVHDEQEVGLIVMDFDEILDKTHPIEPGVQAVKQADAKEEFLQMREYLNHELGHWFANRHFNQLKDAANLLQSVGDPNMLAKPELERAKAYLGIILGYRKWLDKMAAERVTAAFYHMQARGLISGLAHADAMALAANNAGLPPGVTPSAKAMKSVKSKEWYYSQLEKVAANAEMKSGTAEQWLNYLKRKNVKPEEMYWTRLGDFLQKFGKGQKISRDDLLEYVRVNTIKIEEGWYGEPDLGNDARRLFVEGKIEESRRKQLAILEQVRTLEYEIELDPYGEDVTVYRTSDPDHENPLDYNDLPADVQQLGEDYALLQEDIKELERELQDVHYAAEGSVPHEVYTLPNSDSASQRVVALKIPAAAGEKEYMSHTFKEHGNIVVWVRFNTRTLADGRKMLFIEEIQSDLHQEGRDKGYKDTNLWPSPPPPMSPYDAWNEKDIQLSRYKETIMPWIEEPIGTNRSGFKYYGSGAFRSVDPVNYVVEDFELFLKEFFAHAAANPEQFGETPHDFDLAETQLRQLHQLMTERNELWRQLDEYYARPREDRTPKIGPPELPYKDGAYMDLAVKRMVRYAAEHGHDLIGWTTALQQVSRYTNMLRAVVDHIEWWTSNGDKFGRIHLKKGGRKDLILKPDGTLDTGSTDWVGEHINSVVGRDIGERIMTQNSGRTTEDTITIGGKGFIQNYDKTLVDKVNKYIKPWNSQVTKENFAPDQKEVEFFIERNADDTFSVIQRDQYSGSGWGTGIAHFITRSEAESYLNDRLYPPLSTVDVDFIIPREGGMIWTVTQTNKETGVVEKQETFKVLHDAFARSDEWKAAVPRGEIPKKTVPKHNNFSEQWVFPVTDEMREVALAGVPQFAQKVVGNQSTIFDLKDQNYSLSFDEYLAHRMERAGARVKVGADGKLEYASDLDRVMGKHIFNRFTSLYESIVKASEANPEIAKAWSAEDHPYDAFIRRILVKNEWDRVMERVLKQGEVGLIDILMDKKVIPGMDPKMWAGLQEHLDNFNAAMGLSLNLIQLAKLNPHTFLKPYYEATANEWAAHGRTLMKMSVDTLHAWRRLGKEGSNKVTNVLMQETLDKEPYTPTQIGQKLTPAEAEVYYRIRSDLNHVLNEMERITRLAAEVNYSYDPERLETTLKEIELNFGEMRNSGYFPLMRHGKHLVIVRADKETIIDGKKYKKHDLVHWEAFDYEYERNAAARELGKNPDLRVGIDTMTDTAYAVQGIPLPMMRMLRARLEASGATSKVLSELDDAIKNALPLQSFHRKFLKRRGIAGFSKDFERSYARYMSSAANHMSRVEAGEVLRQILVQGEQEARILRETGRDATKRSAMVEWAKKHHQYLMNPQNELQGLRSFAFLWYLGFNIKSAAVNLTQPLITGYPYLADQFGDVAATKHMILANKDIAAYFKDRAEWLQAAMKEEDRKFAYVQEVAPGQFALDGMHQLFDLNDPQGKFFNLTGLKMANTNDPDVVQKLITTRLAQVKREVVVNQPLQQTLEAALSLYAATPSVLSQQDFEMMTLSEALPEAGYDGVVVDSNGDSIVLVPHRTLDKRQIPLKEAVKRSQIQSGDLRGELMRMIQRGQSEGWLDQSLAMELAIAASENKVDRLAPIHAGQRAYYKIAEWGSLPFHAAEKMNRLLMAISYYRAAREEGIDAKAAEQGARECVRLTMYEHTNWNRPVFMRGKKSLLFVFKNYVQNTAFTALQGDGTALRMWLVLGMMAGLQGLPFAEDLADLIDYVATEFKEKLGLSNPKVQIRQEARQILEELNLNPDLILHGFAQETFGLPWISHNLGFGAPGFDLASSISMGNVIPGTQLPSILSHQGSDRALATAIREFGGAALSAGEGALRAGTSSDPNDAKRLERFLPAFARNVAKSVRYGDQGGEFAASGDPIANFDPFSTREQIELIGQAGGFTPTKVSRGWERYMAERELVQYYQARSAALTKAYSHAVYLQDREAMADTMKAIQTYNSAVPYPEMRIGASLDGKNTLAQSVVDYVESQQKHKLGKGEALKYYRLVEEIRAGYKNPVAEDTVDNE